MKKLFLAATAAMLSAISVYADNRVYTYEITDEYGDVSAVYGMLRRVSPNGQWATGGDEPDETGCFIIKVSDPENLIFNPDGLLLDIDNNGLAVGSWYERQGYAKYKRAAIFSDGEWTLLPLPEEILGQSQAVAISADSKVIAGHAMCSNENPDEPGKYFPIVWRLNDETGEYEISRLYNNISIPGTFGFFVYDMTPDAKIICGTQCLDMGDTVEAMLNVETGELKKFHDIERRDTYDPYFGMSFENMWVDGVIDGLEGNNEFAGMFTYATNNYLFGSHTQVVEANEDGSGIIENHATAYDIANDTFYDGDLDAIYLCGKSPENAFDNYGNIIVEGVMQWLPRFIGGNNNVAGIYSLDDSAKVLTGSCVSYNVFGEMIESPALVILDEPSFSGIADVINENLSGVKIAVNDRTITVMGASKAEIYNVAGQLVATGLKAKVAPGLYMIIADGKSHKIIVR